MKKSFAAFLLLILLQIAAYAVSSDVSVEGTFRSLDLTIMNTCEVQSSLSIGTTEISPNNALEVNGNIKIGNAGASIEASTGKIYGDGSSLKNLPPSTPVSTIGVALDGGGGSPIATDTVAYVYIPYACSINNWTLLGDVSGSIVIDIWKAPYTSYPPTDTNSITNGHEPSISSGTSAQSTNLSNWTTTEVAAGDTIAFHVDSASTVSRATLVLGVTKK